MEEYRIDMKVRNNLILTKIEEASYSSPLAFCNATGLSYSTLIDFVSMRRPIYDFQGKIRKSVKLLCDKLNCIPEELFYRAIGR